MDSLLKADIFFVITSASVVVVAVFLVIALVYVIRIVKDVKYVSKRVKAEADLIALDIDAARAKIKEEGYKAASIADYFMSFLPGRKKRR